MRMRELGNWYSRGYLPHFDEAGTEQLITYRLSDALPREAVLKIDEQAAVGAPAARRLPSASPPGAPAAHRPLRSCPPAAGAPGPPSPWSLREIDRYLDLGYGCCALRRKACAEAIIENWRHFAGQRYALLAWVVMPNHVHVLVRVADGIALGQVVHGWKSYTAKKLLELAPEAFSKRTVWQREYWDRFIRDERHRQAAIRYIHENPVRAGLVAHAENWPWSSAGSADGTPAGLKR